MKPLIKNKIRIFGALYASLFLISFNTLASSSSSNSSNSSSSSMSNTFTYQGRLLNTDGTSALNDIVDFTIGIYDPTGSCLVYEETLTNVDVSTSDGVFGIAVGSDQGSSKRTANDPGLSMSQVFSNLSKQELVSPNSNCPAGYTPATTDQRTFRVSVRPHSSDAFITLKPDLSINAVPYAKVAEVAGSLQGMTPDQFIQVSDPVTQANLKTLANKGDASSLHHHDSLYLKKTGSSYSIGTGGFLGLGSMSTSDQTTATSTMSATDSGKVWYNSTSKQMYFWDGSTAQLLSTASGGITPSARFSGNGSPSAPLELATSGVTAGNSYSKFNVDTYGRITSASQLTSADLATALGYTPVNKAGDTVTGAFTINPSTDVIAQKVKGAAGQSVSLTEWQNSAGTALAKIDQLGKLTTAGITITGLADGVVQSTSGVFSSGALPASGIAAVTANRALASNASGYMSASATTATELGYLSGVTSAVQTQINAKEPTITAGNTAQYWRGDKSWQSLDTDVRAVLSATAPMSYSAVSGTFSITQAATAANGYLSSTDWNTFNNKLSSTLNSAQIFVGNGSNVATGVAMSGDATISNTGAVTLASSGVNAGSYTKVTVDAKGRVTSGMNMAGADVTTALGYTPVNKAGDTMTGGLNIPSGNVGIGTSIPGAKLDVNKTGEAYALSSSASYTYYTAGTVATINALANSVNSGSLIDFNAYNSSNGASNIFLGAVAGNTNGAANFVVGRRTGTTSWAESLRIDTSGNMGIGISAPVAKLHVVGNTLINNGSGDNNTRAGGLTVGYNPGATYTPGTDPGDGKRGLSIISNGSNYPAILTLRNIANSTFWDEILDPADSGKLKFSYVSGGTSNAVLTLTTAGNVGIGTTTPGYILDVSSGGSLGITNKAASGTNTQNLPGSLNFSGYGWNTINGSTIFQGQMTLGGTYAVASGSVEPYLAFSLQGTGNGGYNGLAGPNSLTERMRITNSGNVGIGTTSPSQPLHVAGNTKVTGYHSQKIVAFSYGGLTSGWSTAASQSPVRYNNQIYDYNVGANFNTATGVFTAPVSGIYSFYAAIRFNSVSAGSVNFIVNGSTYPFHSCEGVSCDGHRSGTITVYMPANSTAYISAGTSSGTFQADVNDRFTGTLIHADQSAF